MLFTGLAVLLGTWALTLGSFMLSIERQYWRTFVSFETSNEFIDRRFRLLSGKDQHRIVIFGCNEGLWRELRPTVTEWVQTNLHKWAGQEWFTPDVLASIPIDVMPLLNIFDYIGP